MQDNNDIHIKTTIKTGYRVDKEFFAGSYKYVRYHENDDEIDTLYSDNPNFGKNPMKTLGIICFIAGALAILIPLWIIFHDSMDVIRMPLGFEMKCYYFIILGAGTVITGLIAWLNRDGRYKGYIRCPDEAMIKQCRKCGRYYYTGTVDKCPGCGNELFTLR